jgi:protein TonB
MLLLAAGCLWAADPALKITEADAKKAAIQKPAPEYPMVARQLKVTGKVNLDVVIAEDGSVAEVRIVSGTPILTKPAAEAVKKWRFRPFQADGKPAAALATLSFEFDTH